MTPSLSVVVVSAGTFRNLRRTVRHLRAQTVRERIELVIVAADEQALADRQPQEIEGFHSVQTVFAGPISNVDRACSYGVYKATAPVVALIEDHAYPDPEWAEAITEAHRGDWAAVGSTILNANPRSMISWLNLLIAYGLWTEPARNGEQATLPGHNIAYKRELLTAYGDRLIGKLGRMGGLLDDLKAKGHKFYLHSKARLAHANPSRVAPTATLRFSAGRLYGATRAAKEKWSPMQRIIYTLGGPLIPLVRLKRVYGELFGDGSRAHLLPRVLPALTLGLALDGLGQTFGYAFGPGKTAEILAVFEMDRMQHLNAHDRQALSD